MDNLARKLKNSYLSWLKEEYHFTELDQDVVKIDTPFLDSSFDYIVLYVEVLKNNQLKITDDGWTIDNLISEGLSFSKRSTTRLKMLEEILISFGIERNPATQEISIKTDFEHFAEAKHRLMMGLIRVNDLSFFNATNVKNSFVDDVQELFDSNEILYTPNIIVPGPGGLTFHFDFSIPSAKNEEKLIRTVATPSNINQVKLLSYDVDLASRTRKSKYFGIINDQRKPILNQETIQTVMEQASYPVKIIPFSQLADQPKLLSNIG